MNIPVCRREYKLMLDHRLFAKRKKAAKSFWSEICKNGERIGVHCSGDFDNSDQREIAFLDTRDYAIFHNGLVFRQRIDLEQDRETEYTLKCRSPDRYIAAATKVYPRDQRDPDNKLEEDIGAPFVSRFSHSGSFKGAKNAPKTLGEAAEIFSTLKQLHRDGERCSPNLKLECVNSLRAYELVLKGPRIQLGSKKAEVALILWSEGKHGRPLVAEFSFRYEDKQEGFEGEVGRAAKRLFDELQRLDWFKPGARTKTQYVYRIDAAA